MQFYCELRTEILNADAELVHMFKVSTVFLSYTNSDLNSSGTASLQINLFTL
jgi:hypothetical protein